MSQTSWFHETCICRELYQAGDKLENLAHIHAGERLLTLFTKGAHQRRIVEEALKRLCLTTALVTILAACSGGGGGGTTTETPTSVTPTPTATTNSAPTIVSANADQSAQVGYEFSFDASQNGSVFNDADGDNLTYSITFSPGNSGLTSNGADISGAPRIDGDIEIDITATDPDGAFFWTPG